MPGTPLIFSTEAELPEEEDDPHSVLNLTTLKVNLLLSSDLDPTIREQYCPSSCAHTEISLCFGVAEDALRDLRKYLTIRTIFSTTKLSISLGLVRRYPCKGNYRPSQRLTSPLTSTGLPVMPWSLLTRMAPKTTQLFNIHWYHYFPTSYNPGHSLLKWGSWWVWRQRCYNLRSWSQWIWYKH